MLSSLHLLVVLFLTGRRLLALCLASMNHSLSAPRYGYSMDKSFTMIPNKHSADIIVVFRALTRGMQRLAC